MRWKDLNSYNCFHSALFDMLSSSFGEDGHLLINNRWQFFYNKCLVHYSDDNRILGEYQLLFDSEHLNRLAMELGIKVNISNSINNMSELKEKIHKEGYAVVFANLCLLSDNAQTKDRKCVTTVLIDEIDENYVSINLYDTKIGKKIIEKCTFETAWRDASEYNNLNKCVVEILYDRIPTHNEMESFFVENICDSINSYINFDGEQNFLQGYMGLRELAKDIKEERFADAKILEDSAMYMSSVIKQRECFLDALRKVNKIQENYERNIIAVINLWKNIRMFIYVTSQRKQFDSLKFISNNIYQLAETEKKLLVDIRSLVNDNIKKMHKK